MNIRRMVTSYSRFLSRTFRKTYVYVLIMIALVFLFDVTGLFRHYFEKDYKTQFTYPFDHPNFLQFVHEFRKGEKNLTKTEVDIQPINFQYSSLTYTQLANEGCPGPNRLLILVKSAPWNFPKREAIRSTWGNPRRFSDVRIKTVFLLGIPQDEDEERLINYGGNDLKLRDGLKREIEEHGDIVQADFRDSYYNNTYKLMSGMKWAVEKCSDFRFAFFVDDDMYVSLKNLLKFVRNPVGYPDYWEQGKMNEHERLLALQSMNQSSFPLIHSKVKLSKMDESKLKNSPYDYDIDLSPTAKLYAGFVFFVPPHRHKIFTKWFMPLEEYPFDYYPPYVPAGSIIFSKEALLDIYYSSFFVQPFRFDDIYIGLCAVKMGIVPYHSSEVKFWFDPNLIRNPYDKGHEYLIASHGFDDPKEMTKFWMIQKSLGRA